MTGRRRGQDPFIGDCAEPAAHRAAFSDLVDGDEVVGRVLRTQQGLKPVFVSIGHAVDLDTASHLVLSLASRTASPRRPGQQITWPELPSTALNER